MGSSIKNLHFYEGPLYCRDIPSGFCIQFITVSHLTRRTALRWWMSPIGASPGNILRFGTLPLQLDDADGGTTAYS